MNENPKDAPILVWVRRDFRLADNPALHFAVESGHPVLLVFLRDQIIQAQGAAASFRLGAGLEHFRQQIRSLGGDLLLRSGQALTELQQIIAESGARAVCWNRSYLPDEIARDMEVKTHLKAAGVDVRSFAGNLLQEPWQVQTGTGGHFRVYSPFWRALSRCEIAMPLPAPTQFGAVVKSPPSESLKAWRLGLAMDRGGPVLSRHFLLGETAAQARLHEFLASDLANYAAQRDVPSVNGTSGLSEPLAYGEISARQIWHQTVLRADGGAAEKFKKELAWRDFAWHLAYHDPHILTRPWRPDWQSFPWNDDAEHPNFVAWSQGRTGVPLVDAGMRELFVTGKMHNRVRMVAASYLTKHLGMDWRLGQHWFGDTLVDWDPASNAMGWQWVAGCGPDAAPYFRVFNPERQRAQFDPQDRYVRRWLAELGAGPAPERAPSAAALSYFDAVPRRWRLSPQQPYPKAPIVDLAVGRQSALDTYSRFKEG